MSREGDPAWTAQGRWRVPYPILGPALLLLGSTVAVWGEDGNTVVLPPETPTGTRLSGYPAHTRFVGSGLVLAGGRTDSFTRLPRFVRRHDPARDPASGLGYPDTSVLEAKEIPSSERYPIQLRDLESPSIRRFAVKGAQPRDLPWRVVKAMWDGDALHVKGCTGTVTVSDVHWENVEDGFGPLSGIDGWKLENAYMKDIRDDAVENDDLIPGEISNCLIDGCFTFLSQRPEPPRSSPAVTTIRNCLVHVAAQPHDGSESAPWRDRYIETGADGIGRAPGMIFKWRDGAGAVAVSNSIFRMDALSINGPDDMIFPPGTYENVVLVWTGEEPYPHPPPPGVTVTGDVGVWMEARRGWIDALSPDHPAAATLGGGGEPPPSP